MTKPKSRYKWNFAWTEQGREWQVSCRETGQVLGMVIRAELHGTTVFEALVTGITGADELHLGYFTHWSMAKRAIQAKVDERRGILLSRELEEAAFEDILSRFTAICGLEIEARRAQQDAKHGGPAHDDTHTTHDWCRFIHEFTNRAEYGPNHRTNDFPVWDAAAFEDCMIDVAALAVAAILSNRRKRNV